MIQMDIKTAIEKILRGTKREGIEELIKYLETSDFYTAPASTKFHGSHEGGLAEHSINVYKCLAAKYENPMWKSLFEKLQIKPENLAIAAICHDLCKIDFYAIDYKNSKSYEKADVGEAKKNNQKTLTDKDGEYVWVKAPYYTVENKEPLGHGEKSVFRILKYIKLEDEELYAIRWHMGYTEPKELWNEVGKSMELHPLTLALHEADLEATHILEVEKK